MKEEKNFDKALKNLQNISKKMEREDISIDESLSLYKQGIEDAVFCSKYLDEVEQEVYIIRKDINDLLKFDRFYDDMEDRF